MTETQSDSAEQVLAYLNVFNGPALHSLALITNSPPKLLSHLRLSSDRLPKPSNQTLYLLLHKSPPLNSQISYLPTNTRRPRQVNIESRHTSHLFCSRRGDILRRFTRLISCPVPNPRAFTTQARIGQHDEVDHLL